MRNAVIVHMQISSYTTDGIPSILSDSNVVCAMNQALATLDALTEVDPSAEENDLYFLFPARVYEDCAGPLEFLTQKALLKAIGCTYDSVDSDAVELGLSAVQDRYDFNMHTAVKNLEKLLDYDRIIIWANDPMKVVHWKVAAHEAGVGDRTIIYTYISWWDNPPKAFIRYLPRQLEGVAAADGVFVNSMYAKGMIEADAPGINARVLRLLPLRYLWSIEDGGSENARTVNPVLLYNHRVSSFEYYAKPIDTLGLICDAVNQDEGEQWRVRFTNPTGKPISNLRSHSASQVDSGNWILEPTPPPVEEYARLLRSAWLTVSLFEAGSMWSMSALDAIVSGTPIVYVATDGMAELWPFGEYPWAMRSGESAARLTAELMTRMLNDGARERIFRIARELALQYRESILPTIGCNALRIVNDLT